MSAAAVQPVTLQPLALAEPGTDVSAAAEEQPHHKYPSVQLHHAGALCVRSDFQPCLPLADLCSSQWGDGEDGGEDVDEEEHAAELSEDRLWLKACACFIRTRYLNLTDVYKAVVSGRHRLVGCLRQTPAEDSPAAAVFLCAAAQRKRLKVHR